MDGHLVEVSSKAAEIIQPLSWKITKSEGMPKKNIYSESGDLHTKMVVKFPKTLTDAQKALIEKILPE